MRYLALMCVLTLGLNVIGCSQFQAMQPPQLQVQAMKIAQQTEEGARIEITLLLQNPNDKALPLTYTDYRVEVPGVGVFAFGDETNRTLPAGGTQTVVLPAALATRGRELHGIPCVVSGSVSYDPPGQLRKILTESGVPLPSVNFTSTGPLP